MKCYCTFSYQLPFRHIMSFTEEQMKLLLDPWSSLLSHRDLEALVVLRTFSSLTYSILWPILFNHWCTTACDLRTGITLLAFLHQVFCDYLYVTAIFNVQHQKNMSPKGTQWASSGTEWWFLPTVSVLFDRCWIFLWCLWKYWLGLYCPCDIVWVL